MDFVHEVCAVDACAIVARTKFHFASFECTERVTSRVSNPQEDTHNLTSHLRACVRSILAYRGAVRSASFSDDENAEAGNRHINTTMMPNSETTPEMLANMSVLRPASDE